jgi:hypothetical protein
MNRMSIWIGAAVLAGWSAQADIVELQDGTRVTGVILAENEDSIEIEIGTNERGTIRRVLIIDASEIRTWRADHSGRPDSSSENGTVQRLSGKTHIERLIREAQQKVDEGKLDEGIREFAAVATLAAEEADQLEPADRPEMLELRAYASRLHLAALEGKENMLEERVEETEERLEDLQSRLEDEIEEYQQDRREYERDVAGNPEGRFGTNSVQRELSRREADLKERQAQFAPFRQRTLQQLAEMKAELLHTTTQIELTEKHVEQAEDTAKEARRALR